jgi:membrane-anchored mycosin MYCP
VRLRSTAGRAAGLLLLVPPAAVLGAAAPAHADDVSCTSTDGVDERPTTGARSVPLADLRVPEAQDELRRRGVQPGQGVTVAVIGSGVGGGGEVPLGPPDPFARPEILSHHGTALAGVIAGRPRDEGGPVGIAPAARVASVRVYDRSPAGEGEQAPTTEGIAAGLDWVARNARAEGIRVATVAVGVAGSPALRDAVRRVQRAGVVLVAPTGDRPTEDSALLGDFVGDPRPGEDAAAVVQPAGYPGVVGAGAVAPSGGDAVESVLHSSATDVAVPTAGAVSVSPIGGHCLLDTVSTSWAAAEVSGILALLWSAFPQESPAQVTARLLETADGSTDDPSPLTGAGVAQPLEALDRDLVTSRTGRVTHARPVAQEERPAAAPPPEPDVLAESRDDFLWWGLGAGGLLALALLLRPLLRRRG